MQQMNRINRRAANGNGLFLPRVFDKEMFQFTEVMDLAFAARFRGLPEAGQQAGTAITGALKSFSGVAQIRNRDSQAMNKEEIRLTQEDAACGDNKACLAKVKKEEAELKYRAEQMLQSLCLQAKSAMDLDISKTYKIWHESFQALQQGTPDMYAFTDPILNVVYVPSINSLMQVHRENGGRGRRQDFRGRSG